MPVTIEQRADYPTLIADAARVVAHEVRDAVDRWGTCRLVLAGGETPRALYEQLAAPPLCETIPWVHTHWFFGDERWVPHADPRSNAAMVERALFAHVAIPRHHIYPVSTNAANPEAGATAYETMLRAAFRPSDAWPVFDVAIMGLGPDGHTASLFPHDAALAERTAWVTATRAGSPVPDRITLTIPVFTYARFMLFLVSGTAKAEAIAATLEGTRDPIRWPAQAVQSRSGRCVWFVDRDAASKLGHKQNPPIPL